MGLWKCLNVTVLDQLEEELHLLLVILNGDSLIQPMDPERKRVFFSPGRNFSPHCTHPAPCLAVDFTKQSTTEKHSNIDQKLHCDNPNVLSKAQSPAAKSGKKNIKI